MNDSFKRTYKFHDSLSDPVYSDFDSSPALVTDVHHRALRVVDRIPPCASPTTTSRPTSRGRPISRGSSPISLSSPSLSPLSPNSPVFDGSFGPRTLHRSSPLPLTSLVPLARAPVSPDIDNELYVAAAPSPRKAITCGLVGGRKPRREAANYQLTCTQGPPPPVPAALPPAGAHGTIEGNLVVVSQNRVLTVDRSRMGRTSDRNPLMYGTMSNFCEAGLATGGKSPFL